jgi:Pectate lyase superfamily protein
MQFTTGSTGITVSQLGRWVIAANSQSHQLELVDASTGSVLAATTLNTAGLPAGFAYAPLPSPVTLSANHSYYLVSLETVGGDYWYDNSQITTPTSLVKSIDHGIFSYNGAWYPGGLAGNAYVPTDLIGALTTSTAPTASLTANPPSTTSGQSSTLSWSSTNATTCTGTGFSTGNAVSGSVSVAPTTTTSYFVTCTSGSASASTSATVTVTGTAPTASLAANPTSISSGQSSTLTWSSTHSISCTGSGFSTGNAISGSVSVSPTTTTGYSVSCTNGTTIATANATVSLGGSSGVSMDVAPGPFNSWLNVKTGYGAVGDGVHDDTNNIQSALSAAQNNSAVVYFPAGTYKITSTLAINNTTGIGMVGHSSADTTLKWAGASGGTMFDVSGWNEGAVERLTFDGNNIAAFLHYSVSNTQSSSGVFYLDNVFQNAQYGMLLGSGTTDDAERFILRNTFQNLSTAAISAQSNNALDIWPFYSIFNNNAIGVEGTTGNSFCIFCNFSANAIDIHGGGGVQGTVSWGNYSTGARQHLLIDGCGSDNGYSVVQDDTIVNVTGSSSPIASSCGGAPMLVLHNQIGANITPVISQNTGSGNGADLLGVNNLFTKASGGMSATGTSSRLIEVGSTYSGAVTGTKNAITPAPQATGTVLEPSSATGSAIQLLINTANTSYKGQRPVIHLGANTYNVTATITIPAGLDVVISGDAYGTNINWTGSASGAVFQCSSPCKAYFMDMRITAPSGVDAVLIGTEDSVGSYVNVWYLVAQNTNSGVLVGALNNTAVNFYGLNTYTAGTNFALNVTGNNTLTAQARTAVFAGTISNSYPYTGALIGAINCPNLVMRNAWMEKDAYLGTFTCGNISFDGGQFAPSAVPAGGYMMSLNGFNGDFSMLNFQFSNGGDDAMPPQIVGSTTNTNVLFGMNWFRLASGPAYDLGWSTGGNTHGLMNWTGANPTPIASDKNGVPPNSTIASMLNQLMTTEPMQNLSAPTGATAAVVQNVFVQGSAAPLHVKSGI